MKFNTNYGEITFNIIECSGQETLLKGWDTIPEYIDGAILMFSVTSQLSYESIPEWWKLVKSKPIVLCGNKVDSEERIISPKDVLIHRQLDSPFPVKYYEISSKSNYQYEKPFLHLARQLSGHPDLNFVEWPAVEPAEVFVEQLPAVVSF